MKNEDDYPRIRDLPAQEREPFRQWLRDWRCTMPWKEGALPYEQDHYYPLDYIQWKKRRAPYDESDFDPELSSLTDLRDLLPGVVKATFRLRGPKRRLHADCIVELFGYSRAQLGRLIDVPAENLRATPEAESIQEKLKPFEQIARLLVLNDDEAALRTWLNAPNTEFDGRSPNDIIGQQGPQIVADLVRDIITNRGG